MEAGPEIPPHILEKRKRKAEEAAASLAIVGSIYNKPDLPKALEKRPRIIGPALPSSPLDERPSHSPQEEEDDSSDNEIGPSLPSGLGPEEEEVAARERLALYEDSTLRELGSSAGRIQRDSWMIVPPKESDWAARVDPAKIRARKFRTGKGAKAKASGSGGNMTLWTETPAEKQQRVQDEVLGLKKPATEETARDQPRVSSLEAEETSRRIKEYNEKHRSTTLYDQHGKRKDKIEDDDPSKRAWDREKDFALGRKVTNAQRKELLSRAAQFGDRFSSGSYL